MQPVLLLVIAFFIVLVLIVLTASGRRGRPAPPPTDADTFDFEADNDAAIPTVRRATHIVAPVQQINGSPRHLSISVTQLPNMTGVQPPPEKDIAAIFAVIINPRVVIAGTETEVYDFADSLTVTVNYTGEDAAAYPVGADGNPTLSLATAYQTDDGWKFEKLATTVTPDNSGGGTLTAALSTLHPKDPLIGCHP